jgi:hypothetical protein
VYAWGIVFALLAGVASQAGHICQKLVVNAEADGRGGFFTRLLRRPLWLAGLVLEIGLSTVFFLLAQVRLGPALIPGLMATGLIVLAVGSARIVREALSLGELLGIILLIASAVLLGSSRLAIDLSSFDIFEHGFLGRAALFSAALVLTNLFGIAELQRAFRVSRAAVAVPLQTLPTQVAPGLVYLLVFRLPPPSRAALWLFALGAGLILISSFLLGRRQPGEARSSRRGRTAVQRPA